MKEHQKERKMDILFWRKGDLQSQYNHLYSQIQSKQKGIYKGLSLLCESTYLDKYQRAKNCRKIPPLKPRKEWGMVEGEEKGKNGQNMKNRASEEIELEYGERNSSLLKKDPSACSDQTCFHFSFFCMCFEPASETHRFYVIRILVLLLLVAAWLHCLSLSRCPAIYLILAGTTLLTTCASPGWGENL